MNVCWPTPQAQCSEINIFSVLFNYTDQHAVIQCNNATTPRMEGDVCYLVAKAVYGSVLCEKT